VVYQTMRHLSAKRDSPDLFPIRIFRHCIAPGACSRLHVLLCRGLQVITFIENRVHSAPWGPNAMKSALEIVAYTNSTETEGTIALLELAIAKMRRTGFAECAELADQALDQFVEETVRRMKSKPVTLDATMH